MSDFIIDESFEEEAFGIYPGPGYMYSEQEREIVDNIHSKYEIDVDEVFILIGFVKKSLPSIFHQDLSNKEKTKLRCYFENTESKPIDRISFSNPEGIQFILENPDLIEVLMKYVRRRCNFIDTNDNKAFKKFIAKTLYKRLIHKLNQTNYNAKVIIGLIFSLYRITLINNPILSEQEYGSEGYIKYLEQNIRSFLTD